jgi:ATP-dependent RNA helicase DDX19/DBP5
LDRLKKKQISVKSVKRFVLDEADMLIEDQAKAQTRDVRKALPKDDLQVALFSATFPDRVNALREELCPNAMVFATQNKNLSLSNIHQYYIDCNQKKDAVLEDLFDVFGADGQVIIFANVRCCFYISL